MTYILVASFTV